MKKAYMVSCLLFLLLGCANNDAETKQDNMENTNDGEKSEVFVSAAASLTDAMDEIKKLYEEENNDTALTFNFAGSGKLAQQIQQGAPVDVFISANENWMDTLVEEDYIDDKDRKDITGNRLVVIATKPTTLSYETFEDIEANELDQIAIGNPESVPAGEYSEAILKSMNKWDELEDSFVYAKDVRQVLTYVETGNADIGFVYESDALSSDKVTIMTYSNPDNHDPIIYPGAVLKRTGHKKEGQRFLEFLESKQGQQVLEKYGFTNK